MSTLINDIKYAFRQLRKSPGFTALVVLTLGLGIGANTTIFSFLDRILLRPLPVEKPRELVKLERQAQARSTSGSWEDPFTDGGFTYPLYTGYRDQSEMFSGLIAYASLGNMENLPVLRVGDSVEQIAATSVSHNYFTVLGIEPVLGRFFLPEEESGPAAHAAVISHRLWCRLFDGNPVALGKTITLNNRILTVVGVTPPAFTGTEAAWNPEVYIPLGMYAQMREFPLDSPAWKWLSLLGRLEPGVSHAQAEAKLLVLTERIHGGGPSVRYTRIPISDGSRGFAFFDGEAYGWLVAMLFQAPTLLVLLVACANVGNILLARGMMRQREIAIRRALGAGRADVIRQLLVESAILALLGGGCGALLAHWLTIAFGTALPLIQQVGMPVGVDRRILLLTLLGSLGSVFLFGLAPALRVSRPNVMPVLKDGAGAITLLFRRFSLRNGLGGPKVMIVNKLLAEHFWPGQDPIGKHVTFNSVDVREVIGVVKTVKFRNRREKPAPLMFWPLPQGTDFKACLLIRTQGDHQALVSLLKSELESAGLTSAIYNVSTLAERSSDLLNIQRVITGFLSVIGTVGLLFVATGIDGVVAYEVSQRTREIGIRMALGAEWQHVLKCVLRTGAILTGIGLALGMGLSCIPFWILTRLVPAIRFADEYFFYGVRMWDPLTYLCVALLVSLIMLAACWFPARCAARIHPMEALRYE